MAKYKRAMRIELTYQAWKACVLPLNYAREISEKAGEGLCSTTAPTLAYARSESRLSTKCERRETTPAFEFTIFFLI